MNYEQAITWIHSREKFKVKPGLSRMEWMMRRLGHPERSLSAIHVAGTNGKGSTVTFLRNLLQSQGYQVGAFTSPYITRFNERISINGIPIEDEQLAQLVKEIKPIVKELAETEWGEPTEFEVITAMAILYFSRISVDLVLFETGLGGRYDSTNVITPLLSVITNVGLDHVDILGETYTQIAKEKAGIIKQGVPVITAEKRPEVLDLFYSEAFENQSVVYTNSDYTVQHLGRENNREFFSFVNDLGHKKTEFSSPMLGAHQVENAGLALQTIEVLRCSGISVNRSYYSQAILETHWPARFEIISDKPTIILDGAHNREGTEALVQTIKGHYPNQKVYMLYAAVSGKPVQEMLNLLSEVVKEAWLTSFNFPKALSSDQLMQQSPIDHSLVKEDYKEAFREVRRSMTESDILLVTGSLYFISDFRNNFYDYPI